MHAQPHPVAPHRRRKPTVKKEWMPWLVSGGAVLAVTTVMIVLLGIWLLLSGSSDNLPAGVTVAGLSIGGQSADYASAYLQQNIGNIPVTVRDGDRTWTVSLSNLGVGLDLPATLDSAQHAAAGTAVQPWYTIDLVQTQNALFYLSDQVNIPAVPGNPPKTGRAIDIPVVLDRLRVDVTGELADGVLDLTMIDVQPPPTTTSNGTYTGTTSTHVVEAGEELALIALQYNVSMQDIINLNNISDPNVLYVGQELTIPAAGQYTPTAAQAPPAPTTVGKSIVVSTGEQRIYAYENGQLVRSHLVSTGLPGTPTVLGDYKIYVKYTATDMSGPDYYLPQVPYTMYFYEGYGIHGTYWHNSFGRPMSHGCVNLPTSEAEWFFNWAEVGTPVRVI
jgi:lipoprotein-anchoring transpeptidase ErfK/SrfK